MGIRTVTIHTCGGCDRDLAPGCRADKCAACGGDRCYICTSIIPGCVHGTDLCRTCVTTGLYDHLYQEFGAKFHELSRSRAKQARRIFERARKQGGGS